MFTLLYNGIEKSLADWGLSNIQGDDNDLAAEVVTFIAGGREVDAADLFPYGSTVEIFQDRTAPGVGGKRCFYGRVEPWTREGNASAENHFGRLVNPWWYLTRRTYQQRYRQTFNAGTTYNTVRTNRVILNILQDQATGNLSVVSTGEQIRDVLQFAIDCGAPIQIGNIAPWAKPATDFVKNIKCDQVIRRMWDIESDFVVVWDYSTMPYPTVHFLKSSAAQLDYALTSGQQASLLLTPVTLDLNAGNLIDKIKIIPRPDWKKSYVKIDYDQTNSSNGQEFLWLFSEWYSALGQGDTLQMVPTPLPTDAESQFAGLDLYYDLAGGRMSSSSESTVLNSVPFDITSKDQWIKWSKELSSPSLASATIVAVADAVHPAPAIVCVETDSGGNPIAYNSANCYELQPQSGHYHDWLYSVFGITAQKVRAVAWFRIVKKNSDDRFKMVTKEFLAISLNTGGVDTTKTATTSSVQALGEPAPTGIAKIIWQAWQQNAVEGSVLVVEDEVTNSITRRNCLNFISSKQPTWANINALIRRRSWLLDSGTTSFQFGAPLHISANELTDMLRAARNRTPAVDMAGIFGGALGGGGASAVRHPRKEHAHSSEIVTEPPSILGVSASNDSANETDATKRGRFSLDSALGQITYKEFAAPPNGAVLATAIVPRYFYGAGPPSATTLAAIAGYNLRDRYTDETAKADYVCKTAGTKSTSAWAQISGGGAGGGGVWL